MTLCATTTHDDDYTNTKQNLAKTSLRTTCDMEVFAMMMATRAVR